jgi:hypothetical protein
VLNERHNDLQLNYDLETITSYLLKININRENALICRSNSQSSHVLKSVALLDFINRGMSYEEHRNALLEYLYAKLGIEDFHACRDVIIDLEVLDATERGRKEVNTK